MITQEALEIQKWLHNNHFLFNSTFERVQESTDMAIRSLQAWEKVKEELESIAEVQADNSKKKLIIEIPEDEYDLIMKSDINCMADSVSKEAMMYAIKNGKPVKNFFL